MLYFSAFVSAQKHYKYRNNQTLERNQYLYFIYRDIDFCMIIHIFSSTGNYPVEFVNFVSAEFPEKDQIFVFRKSIDKDKFSESALKRVVMVTSKWTLLFKLTPLLAKADQVVFHSFPIGIPLFYWLIAIRWVKKATLAVYGAEIYWYKYVKHTAWASLQEGMRKKIFRRFASAITIIKKDYQLFRDKYAPDAEHFKAFVPIPGNLSSLEFRPSDRGHQGSISILLGNSSNPSNHHIEILNLLTTLPCADEMELICPLSYGDEQHANRVEERGKEIFGTRFRGLREFMAPDQYNALLYAVDLAIMNHDRQQALGNIFMLLFIGKNVFLRRDNPAFDFLLDEGIKVKSIDELATGSTRLDFVLTPEEAEQNHRIMKKLLSGDHYKKMWSPLFLSHD